MAWIDTTIQEGKLQQEFETLLTDNSNWTRAAYFKKIAMEDRWLNPQSPILPITTVKFGVAQHFLYEAPGGMYYGIAVYGEYECKAAEIPQNVEPLQYVETEPAGAGATRYKFNTGIQAFYDWLTNKFPGFRKQNYIYTYMVEAPGSELLANSGSDIAVSVGTDDLKRAALDVETYDINGVVMQGSWKKTIVKAKPDVMQSPVTFTGLRHNSLESIETEEYGGAYPQRSTNWFYDSEIRIKGWIEDDFMMFYLVADTNAAFDENMTPAIPWFWGVLETEHDISNMTYKEHGCYALFNGSVGTPEHDFDDPDYRHEMVQPLLKDYVKHPSDGVVTLMVHRSKYGSRYQEHYLSWNVISNNLRPDRVHDENGYKYPRAWTQATNDEYKYSFNTSRYTDKVHSSKAYVIHPEEGVRGSVPKTILFNPLSLVQGDKMKVRKATCPDDFDIYRYFLIDAISPMTQRPGTPYRPAGLGIYEKEELGNKTDDTTLVSSVYTIDNGALTIDGVGTSTDVATFKTNVSTNDSAASYVVTDSSGNAKADTDTIAAGDQVVVTAEDGTTTATYTINS